MKNETQASYPAEVLGQLSNIVPAMQDRHQTTNDRSRHPELAAARKHRQENRKHGQRGPHSQSPARLGARATWLSEGSQL